MEENNNLNNENLGVNPVQPVEPTPVEPVAPVQEIPVQEVPVQEIPVQEVPVQEVPVQEVPVQEAPVQEVPVQQIPVEQPVAQEVPNTSTTTTQTVTKKKFPIWIPIVIILVIAAAVAGVLVFMNLNNSWDKKVENAAKKYNLTDMKDMVKQYAGSQMDQYNEYLKDYKVYANVNVATLKGDAVAYIKANIPEENKSDLSQLAMLGISKEGDHYSAKLTYEGTKIAIFLFDGSNEVIVVASTTDSTYQGLLKELGLKDPTADMSAYLTMLAGSFGGSSVPVVTEPDDENLEFYDYNNTIMTSTEVKTLISEVKNYNKKNKNNDDVWITVEYGLDYSYTSGTYATNGAFAYDDVTEFNSDIDDVKDELKTTEKYLINAYKDSDGVVVMLTVNPVTNGTTTNTNTIGNTTTGGTTTVTTTTFKPAKNAATIAGTYKFYDLETDDEDFKQYKSLYSALTMKLDAKGYGTMEFMGEVQKLAFDDNNIYNVDEDGEVDLDNPTAYTVVGNKLTFADNDMKLILTK